MTNDQQCTWSEDSDGYWQTTCQQSMVFEYAKPFEQGYKFCHHCGKPIQFVEYSEPTKEEEP